MVIKKKGVILINSIIIMLSIIMMGVSTMTYLINRGNLIKYSNYVNGLYFQDEGFEEELEKMNRYIAPMEIDNVIKDGVEIQDGNRKLKFESAYDNFKFTYLDDKESRVKEKDVKYVRSASCTCKLSECSMDKNEKVILIPNIEVIYE